MFVRSITRPTYPNHCQLLVKEEAHRTVAHTEIGQFHNLPYWERCFIANPPHTFLESLTRATSTKNECQPKDNPFSLWHSHREKGSCKHSMPHNHFQSSRSKPSSKDQHRQRAYFPCGILTGKKELASTVCLIIVSRVPESKPSYKDQNRQRAYLHWTQLFHICWFKRQQQQ